MQVRMHFAIDLYKRIVLCPRSCFFVQLISCLVAAKPNSFCSKPFLEFTLQKVKLFDAEQRFSYYGCHYLGEECRMVKCCC